MSDTSLEDVAVTADQVADDQRQVARQARAMQRQHDRGMPWSEILDHEQAPRLLDLLRHSRLLLSTAVSTLMVALARELSVEGHTRRQVALRLGVTHQRITTLLHRHSDHGDE